ncbi:bifunctional adenosylcobinamide kinase/adenosylcobinamide-phosphate guanylyltransferase [Pseudobutyrivibrio xylanivorans]|uniref:Adenosylcobinamide kinase n=1 Tax=Pseudobutyrivibrio xylanivorans TaxID=185007 RepID=A0A5P6VU40_PSEXY|nr:bifunctional adenosylcobinamide kinase/adenosylcobinamide-phosphate guanylyltransferase [Pseudobutyrivibrio xylanivorans]QFJ55842.1 hypothetical protein FXF36_13590 [Pseudobutyrivibrio xylanivorans]
MVLVVGGSYQGKTDYASENFSNANCLNHLHLFIKERLEAGKIQQEILEEIRAIVTDGDWVIISDEIGNGVVPQQEFDRQWREVTGRILISLAKEATEVYKVVCGIAVKVK